MSLLFKIFQILKKPTVWVLIFLTIAGIAIQQYGNFIYQEAEQQLTDKKRAFNGELSPFEIDLEKPFYLYFGSGTPFHCTAKELVEGINLSNFLTTPWGNLTSDEFHLDLYNDKFRVSAIIRDSNGNPIVRIINNTWYAVDPSYKLDYCDRNYNAYAFEVITFDYVPILQVAMVGPNEIQLGGLFYTENGFRRIAPTSNGGATFSYYPKGMSIEEANKNVTIPLLFKYPALTNSSNLGKMENTVYPTTNPLADANSKQQVGLGLQIVGGVMAAIFMAIFPLTLVVKNYRAKQKRQANTTLKNRPYTNPYKSAHQKRKRKKEKD